MLIAKDFLYLVITLCLFFEFVKELLLKVSGGLSLFCAAWLTWRELHAIHIPYSISLRTD